MKISYDLLDFLIYILRGLIALDTNESMVFSFFISGSGDFELIIICK